MRRCESCGQKIRERHFDNKKYIQDIQKESLNGKTARWSKWSQTEIETILDPELPMKKKIELTGRTYHSIKTKIRRLEGRK